MYWWISIEMIVNFEAIIPCITKLSKINKIVYFFCWYNKKIIVIIVFVSQIFELFI